MLNPVMCDLKQAGTGGIIVPTKNGEWICHSLGELDNLATRLNVPKVSGEKISIRTPNIWSRPLLFESALIDDTHPLYETVRDEWRGLLSLFAFRELKHYDLLTVEEAILNREDVPKGLQIMNPPHTLDPETREENRFFVFSWDGKPFAGTWPSTLVFTSEEYPHLGDFVPWYTHSHLTNPTIYLKSEEKVILAQWLNFIRDGLLIFEATDLQNSIIRELNSFSKELGKGNEADVLVSIKPIKWQFPRPFDLLSNVVLLENEESDVMIHPLSEGRTKILLVDPAIPISTHKKAKDITVWGGVTLDMALDRNGQNPSQLLGDPLPDGVEWCRGEDFFSETLTFIEGKGVFRQCVYPFNGSEQTDSRGRECTPILPLASRVLDYLSPQQISRQVRLIKEVGNQDCWRCEIDLSLACGKITIGKTFSTDEGNVEQRSEPPVLQIWPNFYDEKWKSYYTYFFNRIGQPENTVYAKPYGGNTVESVMLESQMTLWKRFEIMRLEVFPKAFECSILQSENGQEHLQMCGLILLQLPQKAEDERDSFWNVGIDFGTTATNVVYRKQDDELRTLTFKNRLIDVSGRQQDLPLTTFRFFSTQNEEVPILSFFYAPPQRNHNLPLLNGNIFFLDLLTAYMMEEEDFQEGDIRKNLKWAKDPREIEFARRFLEQLCLQTCAESRAAGIKNLSWRFTYPTSFPSNGQRRLAGWWKDITDKINSITGCENTVDPSLLHAEGIASALYFAKEMNATLDAGTVCIDIGGGTSDLSFWWKRNLCYQVSLLYAGRDIFLDALRHHLNILNLLETKSKDRSGRWEWFSSEEIEKIQTHAKSEIFHAQADSLLRLAQRNKYDWCDFLRQHHGEPSVFALSQQVRLGLAGLFYYIGLCIRCLLEKRDGTFSRDLPDIYIGGNGVRILDWAALDAFGTNTSVGKLLKYILAKAMGATAEKKFSMVTSKAPKSEASRGVITDIPGVTYNPEQESWPFSGETFLYRGKEYTSSEPLLAQYLSEGIELPNSLSNLDQFIGFYNEFAKTKDSETEILPPIDNSRIRMQTQERLADQRQSGTDQDAGDVVVIPIFILALRELLTLLRNEKIERERV